MPENEGQDAPQSKNGFYVEDGRKRRPILISHELDDSDLDPFEFRVYARLARRANFGRGQAHESVENMAQSLKMGVHKLRSCLRLLEVRRMVEKKQRPGRTTIYTLLDEEEWHPLQMCKGSPDWVETPYGSVRGPLADVLDEAREETRDSALEAQTSSQAEGERPAVSGPFEDCRSILCEVNTLLEFDPPVDADVRRVLRDRGGLRELVKIVGREKAIRLYVFAHRLWKGRCSWESVLSKRNELAKELEAARSPGVDPYRLKPLKNVDFWEEQYEEVREGASSPAIGWRRYRIVEGERTRERFDAEAWAKERGL